MKFIENPQKQTELNFKLFLLRGVPSFNEELFTGNTPSEKSILNTRIGERIILDGHDNYSEGFDFFDSSKNLKNLLESTIENAITQSNQVGIMLSGGLDSSIIAYIAAKVKSNIFSYTIEFVGRQGPKESSFASYVSDIFGIRHRIIKVTQKEYIENMFELLESYNRPLVCWSAVNQYILSKEARKDGCDLLLSGLGADEVFVGYHKLGKSLTKFHKFKPQLENSEKYQNILNPSKIEMFHEYIFTGNTNPFDKSIVDQLFPGLPKDIDKYNGLSSYYEELLSFNKNNNPESIFLQHEIDFRVSNILLPDFNLASTKSGLNILYPFLHNDVMKFSAQIPVQYKYSYEKYSYLKLRPRTKAIDKYILRHAFEIDIPSKIQLRGRTTFTAPFSIWLRNLEFKDSIINKIQNSNVLNLFSIDSDFVKKYFKDLGDNAWIKPFQLWILWQITLWENR